MWFIVISLWFIAVPLWSILVFFLYSVAQFTQTTQRCAILDYTKSQDEDKCHESNDPNDNAHNWSDAVRLNSETR